MLDTGYYWVQSVFDRELEVALFDGESWRDTECSKLNMEFFKVIKKIHEPEIDNGEE